jgi:hypothetical protein
MLVMQMVVILLTISCLTIDIGVLTFKVHVLSNKCKSGWKKMSKMMSTLLQTTLNTSLDIINNIKNNQ